MTIVLKSANTMIAVSLLSILLPAASANARAVATVDFAQGKTSIASIAIVPPQAEMITRKVGTDDAMIAEARQLEVYGLENTVRLLEDKGYKIITISARDLESDSELQNLVRRANDRFDEEHAKLTRKPGMIKKGRYTVGDAAQQLADYLNVDAVIFERIYMEAAAGGQMAMALLIGGSSGGANLNVTVVNGDDGSVLGYYSHLLGAIGKDAAVNKSEKMVTQMATKALKKFPARSGAVAAAKSADDHADLEELESMLDEDDEADIEELESLLDEGMDTEQDEETEQSGETESEEGAL